MKNALLFLMCSLPIQAMENKQFHFRTINQTEHILVVRDDNGKSRILCIWTDESSTGKEFYDRFSRSYEGSCYILTDHKDVTHHGAKKIKFEKHAYVHISEFSLSEVKFSVYMLEEGVFNSETMIKNIRMFSRFAKVVGEVTVSVTKIVLDIIKYYVELSL